MQYMDYVFRENDHIRCIIIQHDSSYKTYSFGGKEGHRDLFNMEGKDDLYLLVLLVNDKQIPI